MPYEISDNDVYDSFGWCGCISFVVAVLIMIGLVYMAVVAGGR